MYCKPLVTVVLCGILLTGCNPSASEALQKESASLTYTTYSYPFGTPPALVDKMNWGWLEGEEREQARAESMRLGRAAFGVVPRLMGSLGPDLTATEEPLRVAREIVAEAEGTDAQFLTEQVVGLMLLNHFLAGGAIESIDPATLAKKGLPEGQLEVVAFATDLMIRNTNPNADLLASSLQTLDGYWSAEQIQQQARKAAQGTQRYLDSRLDCSGCGNKQELGDAAGSKRLDQISRGMERLSELASR